MATYQRYQIFIADALGNILPGATVTIRKESDQSLATLFSDPAGAVPQSNPSNSDGSGFFFFHAADDTYRLSATSGNAKIDLRYIQLISANSTSGTPVSGSGAPSNVVGADGQMYIDTGTVPARLYGPKAAGSWPTTFIQLGTPFGNI